MKSARFVGSIDQGTSSTRFMIFSSSGDVVSIHQLEHTQHYPQPGFVEHDPLEILANTKLCMNEALKKANLTSEDIAAIGITNQRETSVVWNRSTGLPYHNAIVWNDNRTASICDELVQGGHSDTVQAITGLPIAPYFSASKVLHMLRLVPGLREDAERGEALFGNVDSWLMWNLTGRVVHATDVTNASRTLLMNLKTLQWDDHLLGLFGIPRPMLPSIRSSSEIFGSVAESADTLFTGVRIAGVLGDQQAALFGQACFRAGEAKYVHLNLNNFFSRIFFLIWFSEGVRSVLVPSCS